MKDNVRVLHITESHSKAAGGVTTVVNDIVDNTGAEGICSVILAASDSEEDVPDGVLYVSLGAESKGISAYFSKRLDRIIEKIILDSDIDVVHLHGFWLSAQLSGARVAKKLEKPFVITVHGMLEPWIWHNKGMLGFLKKKLYFYCMARSVFSKANSFHAITPIESKTIQRLFPESTITLIPNAVSIDNDFQDFNAQPEKIIFYIGRIHPVKGVDLLLNAFLNANLDGGWRLVVAGPCEDASYYEKLQGLVTEIGELRSVQFIGPVYGQIKNSWFKKSWVTVVPSYTEVIGMVNLESASFNCPSITTHATGLVDWEKGGGILVNSCADELAVALEEVVKWTDSERLQRGIASSQLVENRYCWSVIQRKWSRLYRTLGG